MSENSTLSGKGESNTIKLFSVILWRATKESWAIYTLISLLCAWATYRAFYLIQHKPMPFLDTAASLLDPITGLGVFIPSFSFVVIGVFPFFSESMRERMKANSRTSKIPLIRVMLDHFCLVLITSMLLLLVCLAAQALLTMQKGWGNIEPVLWVTAGTSLALGTGLWFLLITLVELLRSVRTMYILIIADYS